MQNGAPPFFLRRIPRMAMALLSLPLLRFQGVCEQTAYMRFGLYMLSSPCSMQYDLVVLIGTHPLHVTYLDCWRASGHKLGNAQCLPSDFLLPLSLCIPCT